MSARRLIFDLTIGEFADDESFGSSDAFRVTGGGEAVYRTSDAWKWVLGAEYVNRANTQILPVAGFIFTALGCALYNLVAGWVGGIEVELAGAPPAA